MAKNANAVKVYRDLVASGLPAGAAVGVVGNLIAESGVNPRADQPDGPGMGIAQWSRGARWNDLLAWAKSHSADPYALDTQEKFLVQEMRSMGVWDALKGTNDVVAAAGIFMRKYEMPADQSDANARRRAKLGAEALMDATDAGGTVLGSISDAAGIVGEKLDATTKIFDGLLWWFNPSNLIRVSVGVSGALFVGGGLFLLAREARA